MKYNWLLWLKFFFTLLTSYEEETYTYLNISIVLLARLIADDEILPNYILCSIFKDTNQERVRNIIHVLSKSLLFSDLTLFSFVVQNNSLYVRDLRYLFSRYCGDILYAFLVYSMHIAQNNAAVFSVRFKEKHTLFRKFNGF